MPAISTATAIKTCCSRGSTAWFLWRNAGAAGFVQQVLDSSAGTTELELADVDGDGDLDRITATPGDNSPVCCAGKVSLALNDGTGTFASASFPETPLYTRQLALADVDADGDLDLAAASARLNSPTRLFLNDGAGAFALDAQALPAVPGVCTGVAFLDAEGDGDADLFLSGTTGFGSPAPVEEVLLLNGPAGFVEASAQLPQGTCCGAGRSLAADLDGDLDEDLLVNGESPRVLLQTRSASFADATPLHAAETGGTSGVPGSDLVLGDLDGDGAADGARAGLLPRGAAQRWQGRAHGEPADDAPNASAIVESRLGRRRR